MNYPIATAILAALLLCSIQTNAAERAGGPEVGDLVRVSVYGQPDLLTVARVSRKNTISFPFIGEVRVGGVTIHDAQATIAAALEEAGIVRNAQVNLLIEGLASGDLVTILGQVREPGRYPLEDDALVETNTLLDLLAVAGGTTETADARVTVFRNDTGADGAGERSRIDVDLHDFLRGGGLGDANLLLRSGDVVVVPETDVFYIYGQVTRPGRYPLLRDMMVMQAISVSGGVSDRGNEKGLVLTRSEGDGQRSREVGLEEPVQAGDVIYVKERFF